MSRSELDDEDVDPGEALDGPADDEPIDDSLDSAALIGMGEAWCRRYREMERQSPEQMEAQFDAWAGSDDAAGAGIEAEMEDMVRALLLLEGRIAGSKVVAKRTAEVQNRWERREKGVRRYALLRLQVAARKTVRTDVGTITRKLSPPRVIVDSMDALADKFVAGGELKALKAKIKAAILATGEVVPGAHLERDEIISVR